MKKVVIVGGGFGGLNAAKNLVNTDFDVTIIDKTNHHVFQPLLYQVATAALSPGDISAPIRTIFSGSKNIKVIMDEVIDINKDEKIVILPDMKISYDYLIIAAGARHSYFGNDSWEPFAPGLKTLSDALIIREKILRALEEAEKLNPADYQKYLNFVVVGGGPTGVEMAGAIAEIVKRSWLRDFKNISASKTKVYLIEAADRILLPYPPQLSLKAQKQLESLGVSVLLNTKVTAVNQDGVFVGNEFIESKNVIWAAGNAASPLLKKLNTELDRAGRAIVNTDLSIPGSTEIFIIGDAAAFKDENGNYLPGVAPVAIQQGKFVADLLKNNASGKKTFKYRDKGILATIGRAKAIAFIKGLKLTGFLAWLAWTFIHIMVLIGFRNRVRVMTEWAWYYITFRHGIRLIVDKNSAKYY